VEFMMPAKEPRFWSPVCKLNVFPLGYCKITNLVRLFYASGTKVGLNGLQFSSMEIFRGIPA
jgi:hypothetical protein